VKWLAKLIRRELRRRAYRADREAAWFVLNYGWKVEEARAAREPAPEMARKRKKPARKVPRDTTGEK